MFKRRDNSHARIDTLIGRTTRIQGDVEFRGGLHVDGRVAGSVRAAGLLGEGEGEGDAQGDAQGDGQGDQASLSVSELGVIEGSVVAHHVILNGRVNGDILGSERVVLGSKARVQGDVHYGVIEMALGAQISGQLVPRCNGQVDRRDAPGPADPDESVGIAAMPAVLE